MGFAEPDGAGAIVGWFGCKQPDRVLEEIADDDPAVVAFLNPAASVPSCTKLGLKRAFDELGTWFAFKPVLATEPAIQEE